MAIYVDNVKIPFKGMFMSHMIADTLAEIHGMADLIGMQQRWFQCPPKTRFPHYDIPETRRDLALTLGAHAVDRRTSLYYGAKLGMEWIYTQDNILLNDQLIAGYEKTILRTQNYAIKIA